MPGWHRFALQYHVRHKQLDENTFLSKRHCGRYSEETKDTTRGSEGEEMKCMNETRDKNKHPIRFHSWRELREKTPDDRQVQS